jgi:hypothetical protein
VISGERMRGMDMGPGTDPGTFGFYVVTWVVMMSAMMLPSVAPMVTGYARLQRARVSRRPGSTATFVTGYLDPVRHRRVRRVRGGTAANGRLTQLGSWRPLVDRRNPGRRRRLSTHPG